MTHNGQPPVSDLSLRLSALPVLFNSLPKGGKGNLYEF